ncbi:MAG: GNAT family N-acetyltransferase [Pseudomonadota bacterium]
MIQIREMRSSEISTVASMCADFSREVAPSRATSLEINDFVSAVNTILERNGKVILATRASDLVLVGFMVIAEREALISGGPYLELSDLYVIPEERNQGVGALLVEHAKEFCRSYGTNRLALSTGEPNHSAAPNTFYLRQGFEFIGPTFRVLVQDS